MKFEEKIQNANHGETEKIQRCTEREIQRRKMQPTDGHRYTQINAGCRY
jgi:hypothetical protein